MKKSCCVVPKKQKKSRKTKHDNHTLACWYTLPYARLFFLKLGLGVPNAVMKRVLCNSKLPVLRATNVDGDPIGISYTVTWRQGAVFRSIADVCRWYIYLYIYIYMAVSENRDTPKSSILIRFSIINHPFWGTPIFGNIHIYLCLHSHPIDHWFCENPRWTALLAPTLWSLVIQSPGSMVSLS